MSQTRLLSISAIAKDLGQPESTLHYWKNRFEPFLPSMGQGRHKRFRTQAVEVFRRIGELLRSGMSTEDVREELGRSFPVNVETGGMPDGLPDRQGQGQAQAMAEMAAAIGMEIAKAIGSHLSGLLAGGPQTALAPADAEGLGDELDMAREELAALKSQNRDMESKLAVFEAELVRLRKDSREMEKYLLSKIKLAPKSPQES
ncbi:MAG: MerR family transcriptional regulator [Desulfovibrionaceae bacterium]|nr:MerR family transcriptional regulator [Desulfovibrionaceae bacterium]MBF0512463.1 MerR family transcriptional regulator [Desulfovibrionaceae bacterium]